MKKCLLCTDEYKYREFSDYCSSECENVAMTMWSEDHLAFKYNSLDIKPLYYQKEIKKYEELRSKSKTGKTPLSDAFNQDR